MFLALILIKNPHKIFFSIIFFCFRHLFVVRKVEDEGFQIASLFGTACKSPCKLTYV